MVPEKPDLNFKNMPDKEEKIIEETTEDIVIPAEVKEVAPAFGRDSRDSRDRGDRKKNERRSSRRPERVKQEFDNKIISARRVTRVVSGGRRFSFSISMVIGDKKGRVGVGVGKAADTPVAIEKAMRAARKAMIKVLLTPKNSIAHPVEAKYSSARVSIMPAPGKGVIAGSAVRVVLELAGVKEVSSKILSRSKNKLNIARSAIKALGTLKLRPAKTHAVS
jgi:small subunit ribosomal protein S5